MPFLALPQRNAGEWQDYLSYANAFRLTVGDNKIFCATEGGLFYKDLQDNSLTKLTRKDGLSDMSIQTIAYYKDKELLLIAYKNSNIDLVFKNQIINLGDIYRKQMAGDKTIYNIHFRENAAYLACGFGIVEINITGREIRDTYIIGPGGSQIPVYDVHTNGQRIYAATSEGIYSAFLDNTNLLDFRSWTRDATIPRASSKFSRLQFFNGQMLAAYTRDAWNGDEVYAFRNGSWSRVMNEVSFVHDMQVSGNYLLVAGRAEVLMYDQSLNLVGQIRDYNLNGKVTREVDPRSAVMSADGRIWIADYNSGLIGVSGQTFEQNLPSGPKNNAVFSLSWQNNSLWVSAGGRTDPWNNQFRPPLFQEYSNGAWNYFGQVEYPEMTGFFDIVQVVVNPADPSHIFAASWGGGLLEFKNGQFIKRYNNLNSPLETAIPDQPLEPFTRIGGMAFDKENRLWITNAHASQVLHSLSPSGEWNSYQLPEVAGLQYTAGQILITENNDKWIVMPRGRDVYVVNQDVSRKRYLPVTSYFNNGQIGRASWRERV